MHGLVILWHSVRLALLHELTYRANFAVQLLTSAIGLGASLTFLAVMRRHADALAGWRPPELLALWGVFYVLTGLLGAIVQPSLQRLMDDVRHGTLDFVLIRPAEPQLLVSVRQIEVWKLVDVAVGVGLLSVALTELGGRVGVIQAAGFAVALVAGGAIAYSCCLAMAALAFWSLRVENALILFLSLWETGRWPVGVYPAWLRGLLTFLVPIALATTLPAEVLVGGLHPTALAVAVGVAVVLLVASRWLWRRGLRRY